MTPSKDHLPPARGLLGLVAWLLQRFCRVSSAWVVSALLVCCSPDEANVIAPSQALAIQSAVLCRVLDDLSWDVSQPIGISVLPLDHGTPAYWRDFPWPFLVQPLYSLPGVDEELVERFLSSITHVDADRTGDLVSEVTPRCRGASFVEAPSMQNVLHVSEPIPSRDARTALVEVLVVRDPEVEGWVYAVTMRGDRWEVADRVQVFRGRLLDGE